MKKFMAMALVVAMAVSSLPIMAVDKTKIKDKNFLGLTQEQRMEDYEYLWKNLKESYPFLGVLKREGIDAEGVYKDYKQRMSQCQDDVDYIGYLNGSIHKLQGCGHVEMFEPEDYTYVKDIYNDVPDRKMWAQTLNKPLTTANYKKLDEVYRQLGVYSQAECTAVEASDKHENVTTKKLVKDKVAYMKIDSFDANLVEIDHKRIMDFYKEVKDYDHLIIDLTENGGGSDDYWINSLVAPNITAPLTATNYALVKNTINNKPYLEEAFKKEDLKDIKNLPQLSKLPKLQKEDLAGVTHFVENATTVKPFSKEKAFKGKIWVLVSGRVYSSSESFSMYCKTTGFATLVGSQTGGDGGGIDPVYITLPNSGLIVRYSMLYTLNSDGSNSEECGTVPDIISPEGERLLDTCLKAINQK